MDRSSHLPRARPAAPAPFTAAAAAPNPRETIGVPGLFRATAQVRDKLSDQAGMTFLTARRNKQAHRQQDRAVLDALAVPAFACATDLAVTHLTPAARQWSAAYGGGGAADMPEVVVDALFPPSAGVGDHLRAAQGRPVVVAVTVADQDFEVHANPIADADGAWTGYACVVLPARSEQVRQEVRAAAEETSAVSTRLLAESDQVEAAGAELSRQSVSVKENFERLMDVMQGVADGADMIRTSTLAVVDAANAASGSVGQLAASTSKIGEFTEMITSIAEQTKLLALNATIEATRAGTAGTGFAVVAREVKDLAQRASAATDQVSEIIATLQGTSDEVSDKLGAIVSGVDTVGEQQLAVNKLVDQQVIQVGIIRDLTHEMVDTSHEFTAAMETSKDTTAQLTEQVRRLDEFTAR